MRSIAAKAGPTSGNGSTRSLSGRASSAGADHSQPSVEPTDGAGAGEPDARRLCHHGKHSAGRKSALPASDRKRLAASITKSDAKSDAAPCGIGENGVAKRLDWFESGIARTLDRAVCYDTVRGEARGQQKPPDGSGWESNPPGPFSEATPGLKPGAVTRSTYTPSTAIGL